MKKVLIGLLIFSNMVFGYGNKEEIKHLDNDIVRFENDCYMFFHTEDDIDYNRIKQSSKIIIQRCQRMLNNANEDDKKNLKKIILNCKKVVNEVDIIKNIGGK